MKFNFTIDPRPSSVFLARKLLIVSALLAPAGLAVAEEWRFEGRVVDALGGAVPHSLLVLRTLDTGFERIAHADGTGRFQLPPVGAGAYQLDASARGLAAPPVVLREAPAAALEIVLSPAQVVEQVTVVSGSRQEELRDSLNTRVDVVTRAQARDTGYETVGELLRDLPGMMTRRGTESSGAAGEQVQGLDSRQVLVLIDGQPLVGGRGIKRGTLNLDRQSVGRLERVEVVKGASSALYGSDAIGGVINLVTREAEAPWSGGLVASGGSLGTLDTRADGGLAQGRWRAFGSVERHQGDGFDLSPTTSDTTGSAFDRYDGYGKLRFAASPSLTLTAFGNGYWNDADGTAAGELGLQRSAIAEDAQNYGLTADWQAAPDTTVQVRAYASRFEELSENSLVATGAAIPRDELRERLVKVDATGSRVLGERHFLQLGAEWSRDRYEGVNRLRRDAGEQASTGTLWAQDRVTLARRLTVTLGARYDDHSVFGSAFSPKAALNLRVADALRVRASYGRGFRAPDLGQLYYRFLNPTNLYQVLGNPGLQPEHADSYQLGAEIGLRGGRARLAANVFRNDVRGLIDSQSLGFVATPAQLAAISEREGIDASFAPVLGRLLFLYQNVADARTQGAEVDGEAALPAGFSLHGAYTYLDALDQATGLDLTNRNRHHAVVRLAWESPRRGTRANVRASFVSSWIAARSTTAAGPVDTVAPGFQLWDVYVAQRLHGGVEAFAAVDNATDSQDPNTGLIDGSGRPRAVYRPDAGRTYRVGLRVEVASGR